MSYDPAPAAAALRQARIDRRVVLPLPQSIAPATEAQGAAAQLALARLVGAVPCAGFERSGATGKRMQEYLGLNGPAAGFMQAATVFRGDGVVRFADCIKPGVECEVAVRLAHDLPPECDYTAETVAARRLANSSPASRSWKIVTTTTCAKSAWHAHALIADQVYHVSAAVVGDQGAASIGAPWISERCAAAHRYRRRGT